MSERTCFLHAGTGKTGSSAIQYALTQAREALRNGGFLYPDAARNFQDVLAGKPRSGNAVRIFEALRSKGAEAAIKLVRPLSSKHEFEHLVLSSEGFSSLPKKTLAEFADGLRLLGYHTKCLVLFRPQSEFFLSAYLQLIKVNIKAASIPMEKFATRHLIQNKINPGTDWYQRARNLEQIFGKDNLTVHWFPALRRLGPDGVTKAAFAWLGMLPLYEQSRFTMNPIVNPTPGQETLIVLRHVNGIGLGGSKFSDEFLAEAQRENLLGSKITFDPSIVNMIYSATYESNRSLIERYCPDLRANVELELPSSPEAVNQIDHDVLQQLADIACGILVNQGVDRDLTRTLRTRILDQASHSGYSEPKSGSGAQQNLFLRP